MWLKLLGIVVISVLLVGCAEMTEKKFEKVLVLGIDGMDYRVTNSLIAAGKLPNFEKLAKEGAYLKLETSNPPESPVAWMSIATGMNPGKHNMFDFIRRNPQTYIPELALSKAESGITGTNYESHARGTPFWKITSAADIPSTIIRWPVTFPAEKVSGKMLAGLGVPDIRGFLSGYTYYTEDEEEGDKVVQVKVNNQVIKTIVKGPRKRSSGEVVEITTPMEIRVLNGEAEVVINEKKYQLKEQEWSEWIQAKFNVGMFKKVPGIFKAYLISASPFRMYITTIQIDPENPVVDFTYPASYSSELAEEIGPYFTLGMPEETDGYVDEKLDRKAFLAQTEEIEAERQKMFWKEFENFKGVLAFVYDTSDRLQHVFWKEKVLQEGDGKFVLDRVIVDYYEEKDRFLGKVLEGIDEKTLLLIISDHGITSFERAVHMNTWLADNGYLRLTKELIDEDGSLFRYVDWENTRVYSLGFTSIYLNLQGREGKGQVSEVDKEKLINELVTKLENMVDPLTGKKIVHKAYRREEIYKGQYAKDSPDIIIGYNPGYRMSWQTAIGGFGRDFIEDNVKRWNGDHLVDPSFVPGVLFSNIKLNEKAHQMDVAPSVLEALGLEIPKDMDGKSLLR
jgi:predicted AlkP superfamily phosphohydrolase/phosphomutase